MQERLSKLVGIFGGLDFRANRAHGDDLLGDAYEYLMRHFATQSGKSKGQFYTPAEVSRIMAGDRDRPGHEAGPHRVRSDLRLRVAPHQGRRRGTERADDLRAGDGRRDVDDGTDALHRLSEGEDLHDLGAHLRGGIPNRDIDALGAYWQVFPGLREGLFSANGREGYSDARVEADEVRAVVLEHEEFKAYGDGVRRVFDGWRQEHVPRLRALAVGDSPKALIRDLSEDLLSRFAGLPLLDRYGVYQCLMDYWDEVMQDDVYLVVTEGWAKAAQPRMLVPVRGKGAAEPPDLTVKRKKYRMDLVPPGLVVARFFATEQAEVDRLRGEEEAVGRELEEFVEEYAGEDGLLDGATSDAGKVTQAAVRKRLKEVAQDPEGHEERDALDVCLDLMKAHATAKKAVKAAKTKLDEQMLARYETLTAAETAELVVDDKRMASVEGAVGREVERVTGGLVDRVRVLEGRYAKALPELARQVEDYGVKVEGHLRRMGLPA